MKSREILPEEERPPTMPILGVFQKETLINYAEKCTKALQIAEAEIEEKKKYYNQVITELSEIIQSKDKEIAEMKEKCEGYEDRWVNYWNTRVDLVEKNSILESEISALKEEVERLKKPEEVKEEDCDHEFIGQVGYPVVTCIKCGRKDTF